MKNFIQISDKNVFISAVENTTELMNEYDITEDYVYPDYLDYVYESKSNDTVAEGDCMSEFLTCLRIAE